MSAALNPCQCGGPGAMQSMGLFRFVKCLQCNAQGPWGSSAEQAAAKWAEFVAPEQPDAVDAVGVLRKILDLPDDKLRGVVVRLPFWLEYEANVAAGRPTGPTERQPVASPLAVAVETARASARNAELDLRAALNAATGEGLAWLLLYDQVEPATKLADRLESIGQRLGRRAT